MSSEGPKEKHAGRDDSADTQAFSRKRPPRLKGPFRFQHGDILAGLGVALVLIPQSLAYAELAGLPAHRGLYVAAFAPIAASFLASSPWLQTGPVALTSLLTLGALLPLAEMGSGDYVALASLLALVVGGARAFIGIFRLGWMAFLLSQPVIVGFTSAAALLIIGSQLPGAVGVDPAMSGVGARAIWALGHPLSWDLAAVGISALTLILMFGSRKIHPAVPGVLLACLAGIVISLATGYRGATVGEVPAGFPAPSLSLPWLQLPSLILPGIVIAMVGFAEAASVSQALATKERMSWNPDREFLSQGAANLAAGLFGGFPAGGSFSRTSLSHLAGARTRWAGLIAGVAVLLFLPFSSAIGPLPKATLSAVVIAAVWKLIKFSPLLELWRVSRPQALVGWTAFVFTLVLAPHVEEAVILSVALALGLHLWRELSPRHVVRQEGRRLTLELKGVLWFGSAPILEEALLGSLEEARDVEEVVVDLHGLGRIDVTGALVLKQLHEDVESAGLDMRFIRAPTHAHRVLEDVLEWEEDPVPRGDEKVGARTPSRRSGEKRGWKLW